MYASDYLNTQADIYIAETVEKMHSDEKDENPVPLECRELNEAAILCHQERKDWRPCQQLLRQFAACLQAYSTQDSSQRNCDLTR